MVVDDDEDILETYSLVLEGLGYDVVTAPNGRVALERLRDGVHPSVILLDLMMPVMNGWAFRAELLAEPALARIPVVVFSGDHRALALSPPPRIEGVLQKPCDLEELMRIIARHASA